MAQEPEKRTFEWWEARLANMRAADLDNFFEAAIEQKAEWVGQINFLAATADRFALLAAFSTELSDDGRARCIRKSQWIAALIRQAFRDKPEVVAKFDEAFLHANKYYGLFGYGTAAFEIGIRENPEANPVQPTSVLTKRDAAEAQIKAAIRCYNEQDLISAVTLAGAAEECFPGGAEDGLFGHALAAGEKRGLVQKEASDTLNLLRNWAKHSGGDLSDIMEFQHVEAALMIVRAITKFHAAYGEQTDAMDAFEAQFRKDYPSFVGEKTET